MNFEDYEFIDYDDGFIREWQYLSNDIYYTPFEKSITYWNTGNGALLGYTSKYTKLYWDESLIFNL